ncbi:MAG: MFS transporter, partial [Acidimicrobiaceae bacterium]|nr:MFS transporter [Acidimicrobiaceae bacterium]
HKLKLRALVIFSSSLSIIAIVIFALGSSPMELFLSFALLGIPHGLVYPISLNLARNSINEEELDRANSLLSAAAGSANIISPFILGYFADFFGLRWMIILVLIPTIAFAIPSVKRKGYLTLATQ